MKDSSATLTPVYLLYFQTLLTENIRRAINITSNNHKIDLAKNIVLSISPIMYKTL